jgi:hypothetical protein
MATNVKKSRLIYPLVLVFVTGALLIGSCKQTPPPGCGQDTVCVYVPVDNSPLGKRNHFIPVMDIDIYKSNFDTARQKLTKRYPALTISNCETFNKASVVEFFKNPKVVGLKIYYGVKPSADTTKSLRLMIVGVDSAGHDVYIKDPKKGARAAAQVSDPIDGGLEYGQCDPPCTP